MIINESIIRSLIRSLLFESEEKHDISEMFQPDPHHLTNSPEITSKYTVYDTHGPTDLETDENEEEESDASERLIEPTEVIDEDQIFSEIKKVYNKIVLEG